MPHPALKNAEWLLAQIGGLAYLDEIGAEKSLELSENSIRANIPQENGDVIRIKLTRQPDNDIRVRTFIITAGEDVPNVTPANVVTVLADVCGIKAKN